MFKKLLTIACLLGTALSVLAQQTSLGDFNLILGAVFDKSRAAGIISQKNGQTVYKLKQGDDRDTFHQIHVAVTSKDIIFNIIATSLPLTREKCAEKQQDRLKILRSRYPDLEYYANGDADMIYDKVATVVLNCEEKGGKVIFKLEYLHDEIYQALPSK